MRTKTIKARDYRDPKALPELLRKAAEAACPVPKPPPHLFGSREEYRDILEHAADELEQLQNDHNI